MSYRVVDERTGEVYAVVNEIEIGKKFADLLVGGKRRIVVIDEDDEVIYVVGDDEGRSL